MLVIPGQRSLTCEGPTRRELLRSGSIGLLGLNLAQFLGWQATAKAAGKLEGSKGFGSAKSVIMVFLQGGPSHIDLWDPKEEPKVASIFKTINTKTPGLQFTELLPKLASVTDKATMIRSMESSTTMAIL